MSDFAESPERPVAAKDVSLTFDESDVTVTGDGKQKILDGSIYASSATAASTGVSGSGWGGYAGGYGVVINPNSDLFAVVATVSADEDAAGTVWVEQTDGTVIDSVDIGAGGGVVELFGDLSAGTDYRLLFDPDDDDVPRNAVSYPITTGNVDITSGFYDGSQNSTYAYAFPSVEAHSAAPSATAYVEWPMPEDIYAWDTATYTKSPDGETVEVFIEEDRSGWVEIAGPIDRGQSIDADKANNIRYRVEMSRSGGGVPTIDSLARRWKL